MTIILGLDPGLASLGFGCIACTPQLTLKDFGIIQTLPQQPLGDRLQTIYQDLHQLLSHTQPQWVAIEKFFFYRMANTILVAQARGVILLVVAQHRIPLMEFTPAQVKQALTGQGNAPKADVQQAVQRELGLETLPRPDDAADALALAIAASFSVAHQPVQ